MLQLFRVLLPSWKFFDGTVDAGVLWYRVSNGDPSMSEWQDCIPKTGARHWRQLFVNSRENGLFARHALLEYFNNDLSDGSDFTVSLELVKNMVEFRILELDQKECFYQFMFFTVHSGSEPPLYLSPVHERGR